MKKFFVIFCIPAAAIDDWMKNVDEATRKEQSDQMMQDWQKWMADHETHILDKGLPVGKTKRVTKDGITDTRNDINWYLVMQGESHEAVAEMVKTNPHITMIPNAYAEVSDANRSMPQ
jgi:hypothetical protein